MQNILEDLRRFEAVNETESLKELADVVKTFVDDKGNIIPPNADGVTLISLRTDKIIEGIRDFVPHRHFRVPVAWGLKSHCFFLYYKKRTTE